MLVLFVDMLLKSVQIYLFRRVPLNVLAPLYLPACINEFLCLIVALLTVCTLSIVPDFLEINIMQADHGKLIWGVKYS